MLAWLGEYGKLSWSRNGPLLQEISAHHLHPQRMPEHCLWCIFINKLIYTTARSPPVLRTGIGLAGAYWPGLGSSRNLSWSRNGPVVMKIRACHVSRLHRQFMSVLPLPPTVMYTRYIRKYCTVDISPSLVQRTHFGRAKDSKGSVGLVYLGLG